MGKLFRYIIVFSTTLVVIFWVLPFVDYLWLNEEQLEFARYDTWGSSLPSNAIIYWGLLSIWLLIALGLFLFVPIARTAFVVMQLITIFASFFWGFLVLPPVSVVISNMIGLSDGVILAMLFLTSISKKFEKRI